jgi:UDP-glucose 4-epimerase
MRIFVTGHTGFIGGEVAKYFISRGHEVFGYSTSILEECTYEQHIGDITNLDYMHTILSECYPIDVIIHCAGMSIVSRCETHPYEALMANSLGTATVLEVARLLKIQKVILLETDRMYDQEETEDGLNMKEDDPLSAIDTYDASKIFASNVAELYRRKYGVNTISLRLVNVFGATDKQKRFIPEALRAVHENIPISVYKNDANNLRDFVYIKDVLRAIELIVKESFCTYSVYNISPDKPNTIMGFAKKIASTLNGVIIPKKQDEININRVYKNCTDGSRFVREYYFKYTPFEEAIKETYKEMFPNE